MYVADIFCGWGGFSYGFKKEGFSPVFAIDINDKSVETYNKNIKDIAIIEDVKNIYSYYNILKKIKNLRPLVVIGGPPCESHSFANRKRVSNPYIRVCTTEGELLLWMLKIIEYLEPDFFVIENVVGMKDCVPIIEDYLNNYNIYVNLIKLDELGGPSARNRIFISNIKLTYEKQNPKKCWEVIEDLYLFDKYVPNHFYVSLPAKCKKYIGFGKSYYYYRGAYSTMRNYIRLDPEKPAPTVMGGSRFVHPFSFRLLSPREHARLMTYPDDFIFYGGALNQYNMIGESVPPLISQFIAKKIKDKI